MKAMVQERYGSADVLEAMLEDSAETPRSIRSDRFVVEPAEAG